MSNIELEILKAEEHLNEATSKGLGRCKYCVHYHLGHHIEKCDVIGTPYRDRMNLGQTYFDKGILMDEIEALTMETYPCNSYKSMEWKVMKVITHE